MPWHGSLSTDSIRVRLRGAAAPESTPAPWMVVYNSWIHFRRLRVVKHEEGAQLSASPAGRGTRAGHGRGAAR